MSKIENIVVVMLENRSFDNMLGAVSGLSPGQYTNQDLRGKLIPTWGAPGDPTTIPAVDPFEVFDDMAQQILGLGSVIADTNPYSNPREKYGAMGGFVVNYQRKKDAPKKDVMHIFDPSSVPVTTWLAQNFAVCDQWFGSVPTQTFANRMFAQCANPGKDALGNSYIDDFQYAVDFEFGKGKRLPSIFQRLDTVMGTAKQPNWKLYFHDYAISGRLLEYVRQNFSDPKNINVANYSHADYPADAPKPKHGPPVVNPLANPGNTFLEDVLGGSLAPYTFIEPRYSDNYSTDESQMMPGLRANSNHPGPSAYVDAKVPATGNVIDVADGELLLLDIYLALRTSDYWEKTLLIVTYDEHGGCFDHVPPPAATKPGIPRTGSGFNFDVFGPRVPTLIISPFVSPNSIISPPGSTPFDHTSIIKTVWDNFDLTTTGHSSLNNRDAAAPSVLHGLDFSLQNNPVGEPAPWQPGASP